MRKTKLVMTLGPALMQGDRLREALKEADAVRLNASHGDPVSRSEALQQVRAIATELGRHIPVFLDLQGPKWRVGLLETPLDLAAGSEGVFYLPGTAVPAGCAWAAPLPHPELFEGAEPGQQWLLDDGAITVKILAKGTEALKAEVIIGGPLKARKGVHPIGMDINTDPLTEKDHVDIRWGVEHDVDLFAQSFVRRASDVQQLQAIIHHLGGTQPIIAKIEHPTALAHLGEILDVSWGVMVARGDLGVELGVERVPGLQKQIIKAARKALKPVITATQMLESMIEHAQPTRAEASDVANAIWDGTDAVMLSAESASGAHPVEAVQWLARIAAEADANVKQRTTTLPEELAEKVLARTDISVAFAACRTADEINARSIVAFTEGGNTARLVSRLAGRTPVLGATPDELTARRMGLFRGVTALMIPRVASTDEMVELVRELLLSKREVGAFDRVVMTMGLPLWKSGTTNTMKVMTF
ncbi:pyruvate kinase [Geothrix sp. PMB-07]|uniref:pyruvate kinase n=1 Tax=Geothrix sp. PMB-07 TaxID=3068640 RepID=UPI002742281B|nr:pyruvate kinase [Geothrix sp. PMB-07]WLT30016.1 pyruvate kinase [Geothrix sp. PMB-07]